MGVEAIRSDWVGRVIDGRFTLLQWLGGSERSGVFLTELPGPQARKAVIKLIPADDRDAEILMAGWAATRPLSHPHLMRLFLTGRCEVDEGTLIFVVNEYADEVLSEILPERALSPSETREMLEPILDVLSYLHGKGLVHGHIKPSNVMAVDDRLKLSGDSLQVAGETGRHVSGPSIHRAPETEVGTVSPAADVWGLGVTLVEVLTQHPPVWNRTTDEDPAVPESIPQPFAGIARGCLRADPVGRCSLGNVRIWLEAAQPVGAPAGRTEKKAHARNRVLVVVSAAIVLLAVFGIVETRSHQPETSLPAASAQTDAKEAASPAESAAQPAPQPAQDQTPPASAAPDQAQGEPPAESAAPPVQEQPPAATPAPAPAAQVPAVSSQVAVTAKGPAANGTASDQAMPDVSPKALASIHGKFVVRIRVTVDAAGNVSDAAFESEGPSQYFAKAALQAARQWKFPPAQASGQSEASARMLEFKFTRDGAEVASLAAQ